jgi:glycosyltransferase involved in cell wall biosynthesis
VNVLYVIHYPIFGGPHNIALRLAGPLSEQGWNLSVLLPDEPGNAAQRLREANVDVLQIPLHRIRARINPISALRTLAGGAADVARIRSVIRERRIDLVVLTGLVNPQAAVAASHQRVALIWQLVDTRTPKLANAVFMLPVRRFADAAMTTGSQMVARAHPGVRSFGDRLFPFFPPVDVAAFRPDESKRLDARRHLGLTNDQVVIGNASNIHPQKGHLTFVRAAGELRKAYPKTCFVILGPSYSQHAAYEDKLRGYAKSLGFHIGDDFLILDPGSRYPDLVRAFDVFWLTSEPRSEGTPTVIQDAMALGVPVVSTNVGAVSEVVVDGHTGILVEPHAAEAMARETGALIGNPGRRLAMSEAARRWAVEHYDTSACTAVHVSAFRAAIAHRASKAKLVG